MAPRVVFGPAEPTGLLAAAGTDLNGLGSREVGTVVTDHRTSWVRHVSGSAGSWFVKTYDYSPRLRRLLLCPRATGPFRKSRAHREAEALAWLAAHGFAGPRPAVVVEHRRAGLLRRAVIATEAWPGRPLDALLRELDPPARAAVATAVVAFVRALHRSGFRDRNLDPRNLLARRLPDGKYAFAKIDSGRYRLARPGAADDALARADWARLLPQLAALGCAVPPT